MLIILLFLIRVLLLKQGTHESLLLEKGKYFEMWGKQKPTISLRLLQKVDIFSKAFLRFSIEVA